jgi:hypothetical protein
MVHTQVFLWIAWLSWLPGKKLIPLARGAYPVMKRMLTCLAMIILVFPRAASFSPIAQWNADQFPLTLTYIESSQGLIPPTLEGGHTELELGDVNGDGNLDLVSIGDHGSPYVNTDQHGVMVWFGDGTGAWSVYQNGNFGYGGVALGDVNNDGLMDVGYGMHHNYSGVDFGDQLLEVALGDGSGQNWTPWDDGLATSGEDWGMFGTDFADVDHDGDLDVGSISFGCCAGVHVYLNQGDGTWSQSFRFYGGNSNMQFDFGDVNGDGNADFTVSHGQGLVYLGDGAGGFTLGDGNLPDDYNSVALGDVNHDGRDDLALVTNSGGVQVWTWLAPNTWQQLSSGLPSSGPYAAVQVADMNMDGNRDVAAFGGAQVRIWGGDGSGGWAEIAAFNTPTPGNMQAFRAGGDADHNGYPDIALVSEEGSWPSEHNHLHFYRESSTPAELEIKPVFPSGAETFHAGGTIFIDWVSAVPAGQSGSVTLELSIHGPGGPWQTLAEALPDNGRYQWLIPANTLTTSEAFIRYTLTTPSDSVTLLTPEAFNIIGSAEEPIDGLTASNDSPTVLGQPTLLSASVVSGTNVTYAWAFGDGTAGAGAQVSHIYPGIGVYTAVVTATNSVSWAVADTAVEIIEIPIAGLHAVNNSPTILGDTTLLTATVLTGTNVVYEWALGDGTLLTGALVSHVYPAVGTYTAVVTATNAVSWAAASTSVEIIAAPLWRVHLPLVWCERDFLLNRP